MPLDPIALTRKLVDIESITGNERECGEFLEGFLFGLAEAYEGVLARMPVEGERFNLLVTFGDPIVTLTTHYDTVPPFIPSSEDEHYVYGRGSTDAKGILASMICAAERVLQGGLQGLALLFVVGEEDGSAGAYAAAKQPIGSRYLINGEPTENRLALGSKGALRLHLTAKGKMAHSAYPELGESAILKLLDDLESIRRTALPADEILGQTDLNIGLIQGGRAPNVVPDHAEAELLVRLVGDADAVRGLLRQAIRYCDVNDGISIPALHLGTRPGYDTTVVKYTTDVPIFGEGWGEPFLVGPGSIHVAHTPHERAVKTDLLEAVELYTKLTSELLTS